MRRTLAFSSSRPCGSSTRILFTRSGWLTGEEFDEQSTVKQVANAALLCGQNVKQTAAALGLDPRTVQQWWQSDSEFGEAMEDTRREVAVGMRQTLLALTESAVSAVETKLTEGKCPRMALALLRAAGALGPQSAPMPSSIVAVPAEDNPYGLLLQKEALALRDKDDTYLYHEYLEEVNDPVYFHEFLAAARGGGLEYVGEADFTAAAYLTHPPAVDAVLRNLATKEQEEVSLAALPDRIRGMLIADS